MSELNLFESDGHKVHLCPVCGSTDLIADILTSAVQQPDGQWDLVIVKTEDLNHEFSNPNTTVRCANAQCGNPFGPDGHEIILEENETLQQYWMRSKGYTSEDDFDALGEDEHTEYSAWESELYWNTWSGVIGDCHAL